MFKHHYPLPRSARAFFWSALVAIAMTLAFAGAPAAHASAHHVTHANSRVANGNGNGNGNGHNPPVATPELGSAELLVTGLVVVGGILFYRRYRRQ
jgi:hypothetical protein